MRLLALVLLSTLLVSCSFLNEKMTVKPYNNSHLKSGELKYRAPKAWTQEKPKMPMRLDQYRITPQGSILEATLSVYTFPGMVGGVDANLERWIGQFKDDGKRELGEIQQFNYRGLPVTIVYISGTYVRSLAPMLANAPTEEVSNQGLLAAIVELKEKKYFFKMIGDKDAVYAETDRFDELISSLKI